VRGWRRGSADRLRLGGAFGSFLFRGLLGVVAAVSVGGGFLGGGGAFSLPARPGSMFGYEWARRESARLRFCSVPLRGQGTTKRTRVLGVALCD